MVHAGMRLDGFNICINPVNLVNPVENAICDVSCKYSQSATQFQIIAISVSDMNAESGGDRPPLQAG